MADEPGSLTQDLLEALNQFLNEMASDEGLMCPVTAQPTPITEWNAPTAPVVLPGQHGGKGYEALPLTSPAGGVVLISMERLKAWQDKSREKAPPADQA